MRFDETIHSRIGLHRRKSLKALFYDILYTYTQTPHTHTHNTHHTPHTHTQHTPLGRTPLPSEELVVAQRRLPDNKRHPREKGDNSIPCSQSASDRTLAGIRDHDPRSAVMDMKQ